MAIGTALAIAGLSAAATVGGAALSASAANKASKAQVNAANSSNALQQYIYDNNVALAEPFRQAGVNALDAYQYELGIGKRPQLKNLQIQRQADGSYRVADQSFTTQADAQNYINSNNSFNYAGFSKNPFYQFQLDEGMKALERSAAARGQTQGGKFAMDSARFAQGLAGQEYGNYMNRLASLSGAGQTQTNTIANLGQNYAQQVTQNNMNAAQARASGYANQAQIGNSAINNLFSIYGGYRAGAFG